MAARLRMVDLPVRFLKRATGGAASVDSIVMSV